MNVIWNSEEDKPKAQKEFKNEPCPEGTWEFEIVKSVARQSQFDNVKTKDNPDGWEWSLWLGTTVNGTRYMVFDSIAVTHITRINEVLRATGRPELRPGKDHRVDEQSLEGERVRVRVYHSKKTGKARAGDYMKAEEAKKAAPTRGKVDTSEIPF